MWRHLPMPVFALAAALVAVGLGLSGLLSPTDEAFYDRLVSRLPPPKEQPGVVVVAIDDPSFADLGLAWPWPRALHARMIAALRAAGARQVGYDVIFADAGDPADDARLVEALMPDVALASYVAESDTLQGRVRMDVRPLPVFAARARVANVELPLDPDGAIRRLSDDPRAMATVLAGVAPPPGARIRFAASGLDVVSFYQALDPEAMLPPGMFMGKTVLVGIVMGGNPSTTPELFRVPATATGAGFEAGVMIHANAYRSLVGRDWIAPVPALGLVILAMVLAPAAAWVAARGGAGVSVAATLGLVAVPVALSGGLLLGGLWLPPAMPALAALLGGAGQTVRDYARVRRARREILRSFGQYLAPELVARLAENPGALRLGGERRVVTILFCDLRGFTALSERMKSRPDLMTGWLNQAMEVLSRAVVDNGGMVDKYIGDCVMALWNAPADDPDHAAHALAAGRAMISGIAELSDRIGAQGHPVTLACGVGINTGECTVGNMGSSLRFDYTAIGDPVNLASRLEGLTKILGRPLLVGSATAALLPDADLVELGSVDIEGRQADEVVFAPAAAS